LSAREGIEFLRGLVGGKRFADPLGLWRQRAEDVRGEALPSGE
jgi:hypothetical protein